MQKLRYFFILSIIVIFLIPIILAQVPPPPPSPGDPSTGNGTIPEETEPVNEEPATDDDSAPSSGGSAPSGGSITLPSNNPAPTPQPQESDETDSTQLQTIQTNNNSNPGAVPKENTSAAEPIIEEEQDTSRAAMIFIFVGLAGILIGLIILIMLQLKKRSSLINKDRYIELDKYVSENLANGFAEDQIRDALKSQGWKTKDIDAAFKKAIRL